MGEERKDKPCRAGAYRPVEGTIRELREKKGWTQIDLAERVGCSPRTIQSLEAGGCSMIFMLTNLAEAFGVAVAVLHPSLPGAPEGKRVEVQIVLRIPYDDFDQSERLSSVVSAIMAMLKGNRIDVVTVNPGSTVITVAMSPEDAEQFMQVMLDTPPRELPIVDYVLCREVRGKSEANGLKVKTAGRTHYC